MKLAVITPFYGDTANLVEGWWQAVKSADLIIAVCDGETGAETELVKHSEIAIIKNESSLGFAASNDLGLTLVDQSIDVVVFANSDILANDQWLEVVKHHIAPNELLGASLQMQLIAGRWIPYLEGWCIAAYRTVWERLNGWSGNLFSQPYWEDNHLCFRALEAGFNLTHVALPIQHLGGRSIGMIAGRGTGFEANRALVGRYIANALGNANTPTPEKLRYYQHLQQPTDIQHHLPLLKSLSRGNVVELGTRSGVSTTAFLAGNATRVISVDIAPLTNLFSDERWMFVQASSINPETVDLVVGGSLIDTLLIDTLHNYEHVYQELELWSGVMAHNSTIAIHDTETFPGVRLAIEHFLESERGLAWQVRFILPCNGMAILTQKQI